MKCFVKDWKPQAVHLWIANVQELIPLSEELYSFLANDERDRHAKYRIEAPKQQFLVARGLLRFLLSRYLDCQPQAIQFQYSDNGKPALTSDWLAPIHFNIAHSKDWILLAFSQDLELGIDVESIESRCNYREIAERFLRPDECQAFQQIAENHQQLAFFKIWARKEALIKLWGDNLYQGLQSHAVPTTIQSGEYQVSSRAKTVWVQDLAINPQVTAALATFAKPITVDPYACTIDTFAIGE